MEEIWGPTAQQKRYEPPSDLAKRLGNTQPGDGFRYRGRGPIQITGRANYKKYGDLLSVDLVGNPDLAATPQFAFSTAGQFWKRNGLNELADVQDFITITKRINGGLNGLADRQKYYAIAKNVLGADEPADIAFSAAASLAPATRGASADAPSTPPPVTLTRGQEAIEEDTGSAPATEAASQGKKKAGAKKKSARAAKKPAKKLVSKKPVAKAAKKPTKKPAAKKAGKPAKKAAKKIAGKAARKSVKAKKKAPAKKSR